MERFSTTAAVSTHWGGIVGVNVCWPWWVEPGTVRGCPLQGKKHKVLSDRGIILCTKAYIQDLNYSKYKILVYPW